MSINAKVPTAMASGRPTPTPMPAAAPGVIPPLVWPADVQVGALVVAVLALVADVIEPVAVAPLSKRSVDSAAFITARYAPTVKFSVAQFARSRQACRIEPFESVPQLNTPT